MIFLSSARGWSCVSIATTTKPIDFIGPIPPSPHSPPHPLVQQPSNPHHYRAFLQQRSCIGAPKLRSPTTTLISALTCASQGTSFRGTRLDKATACHSSWQQTASVTTQSLPVRTTPIPCFCRSSCASLWHRQSSRPRYAAGECNMVDGAQPPSPLSMALPAMLPTEPPRTRHRAA